MNAKRRSFRQLSSVICCAAALAQAHSAEPSRAPAKPQEFQPNPAVALPTPAPGKSNTKVEFVGVTRFRESELRSALAEQINAIGESGLTAAAADDTAFFLGVFYRKQGCSQAEVKWKIATRDRLVLTVSEGPFTTIDKINFRGNANIREEVLREYIVGTTRERFSRTKKALPFVEADIETGVERIHGLYHAEGFVDAAVDPPEVSYSPDKTRGSAMITIHEGTRYRFGKIEFEGDLVFYPQTDLLKTLEPFSREPFTPGRVTNMQRAVVYYYKSRGYFDAKVDVQSEAEMAKNGLVPVNFHVDSGSVYRFDGVSATGLDRLSAKFLPNRFAKLRGKFYSPGKLDEVFREMMRTGLFKKLRITSKPLPSHEIELDMEVEEAKAKEVGFSVGYGTFEGFILGLTLGDRDLFGTGRPLTMNAEVSQRALKGEVLYVDPWFLESEYSLRLRLYGLSQDYDGYSKAELGGRAELARKLTKHLEAAAFVLARHDKITNNGIDPEEIGLNSYFINSVGTALTLDLRDSAINPGKGFVANSTTDFAAGAIGSSVDFLRSTIRLSYYIPVTKKTLLAFGARAGILYPLDRGDQVPIDERFFNGGSRSVRSFAERELGPKDSHGYAIGGEMFTTFNVEYVFPLVGELDMALFVDAGSVGRHVSNGFGMMRYGVGAGLRYKLPVGPLRLDYGFNPSRREDEEIGAFHFSFGFAF